MLDNALRNRPRELWVPFGRAMLAAILLNLMHDTLLVDVIGAITMKIAKSKRGAYKFVDPSAKKGN